MAGFNTFRLGDSMAQGQELAANNFRLGEAQRTVQAREGLTNAIQGGPEAMAQYSQQFPQEAMKYQQESAATRKEQLEGKLFEFSVIEKLMSGVRDEQSFQQAKQMMAQAGMDVSKVPQNFDPNFIAQQRMQAMGVKGQLEAQLRDLDKSFKERQLSEAERHNRATETIQRTNSEKEKAPKVTDTERVAAGYATRMEEAEKEMATVQSGQTPGYLESAAAALPGVGKMAANFARDKDRQVYRQSQEDWVRAKLRKESGAVIADEEMDREIRVYFPQIGDTQEAIERKARARQTAIEAMKQASGPALKSSGNPGKPTRKVVRTGKLNGRKVVQYDDGTTEYAD